MSFADKRLLVICVVLAAAAGALDAKPVGTVLPFVVSALALAALASLVGTAVDALGDRLGAGATGVVQSALGNLPELFVVIFALRAGLDDVVRAAIVGSILSNVLLVLGLAFLVGGLKHGVQKFNGSAARNLGLLLLLAVAGLMVPALTSALHSPARGHEIALSRVVAVLLLLVFALSLPAALARADAPVAEEQDADGHARAWPLGLAIGMLALAGVGAAFVSDWFVVALTPAIDTLHISEAFAGLVIVAIASNAVENVVGIQLAAKNKPDYAVSVILQSPLQIALVLAPVLVLIAPLIGASFTLVLSPLLIAVLALAVLVTVFVVFDGESTWLEGVMLVALYGICATAFFWG
ncbi:MAG: calcium/proton exchanger [Actinobacteria bacterium]|nr:calcium/proton exchanger [Actinomycetota bacterium]MCA1721444.1 calcium/proton exchanger [Actinomycetota bacterium]